jgi:hypothetical protein
VTRRYIPAPLRTGSEEQSAVRRIFASAGGLVYSTSDPRATRSTPGLSDLFVVLPNRRLFLAWESKVGGETYPASDIRRLTASQREFGGFLASGLTTAFGWGDADVALAYLRGLR